MRVRVADEAAMVALAGRLAAVAVAGDFLLLSGPLGAGKSCFARGFIRALAGDAALVVPSPSFTLVQQYDTPKGTVWHYDLWRLADFTALHELGWDEAEQGIVLVEWPDRLGKLMPAEALRLEISIAGTGREIELHGAKKFLDAS